MKLSVGSMRTWCGEGKAGGVYGSEDLHRVGPNINYVKRNDKGDHKRSNFHDKKAEKQAVTSSAK